MRQLILLVFLLTRGALAANDADFHYDGTLAIDAQNGHISADWSITVFDDKQSAFTFFLRNTLNNVRVEGPAVRNVKLGKAEGLEKFTTVQVSLETGQDNRVITMSYDGILLPEPMENRINSISPDRVELNLDSFWFPIDSSFEKKLTSVVTVDIGDGWTGVTTGTTEPVQNGVRFINDEADLDIAFTLARKFHIREWNGFTIYDQRATRDGTDRLLEAVQYCVDFLNARFGGNDPVRRGSLLITDRASSGYARLNYVVFTDISKTKPEPLTRFVCHEFSHYWNRGAAFNTVENWLNEAFAEYMGVMAVRARFGGRASDAMMDAFHEQIADEELPPIWQPGDTERGPYLNQYRKGPLVLERLEKDIGRVAFLQVVQSFVAQPVRTTPMLLSIIERIAGEQHRLRFEDALAGREVPVDPARVMILGTFHFKDAGLDSVKAEAFDIHSTASQAYLTALARRLAGFAPTRVLVEYEASRDEEFNAKYRRYLAGDFELPANEIYQLGFRVAKNSGLDQVYGFDERSAGWNAGPMFEYGKQNDAPEIEAFESLIETITEEENAAREKLSLEELLVRQNTWEAERANMDIYLLTNSIGAGDGYSGADASASWWRRNFRMYANLQRAAQPGERLLVIGGTGHTAILKQLLDIDQRIEAVDVIPALVSD